MNRFLRAFFWAILGASILTWLYLGLVSASARQAILIEYKQDAEIGVIAPGDTSFIPSRAFPGRVRLHPVRAIMAGYEHTFRQGLLQTRTLGLKDEFFIKLSFEMYYDLDVKPDRLRDLFSRLGKPDWSYLNDYLAGVINRHLEGKVLEFYPDERALPGLRALLRNYIKEDLSRDLKPLLAAEGILLKELTSAAPYVPDPVKYLAIVARSDEFIDREMARIKAIDEARTREYAERIVDNAYFKRLEKIGQLLNKYPRLREYLAIDRLGKNVEVMVLPSEKWFGSSSASSLAEPNPLADRLRSPGARTEKRGAGSEGVSSVNRRRTPPRRPAREGEVVDLTPP